MLRDKILFVIKLQKLKKQVSFCHPSQRNEHIKMWETHPNDTGYFPRWWTSCHSFPGPPLFKMAAESNFPHPGKVQDVKFPTCVHFTEPNSRGLPPPSPQYWGKPLIGALFCLLLVTSTIILLITIYRRNVKNRLGLCDMYYVFCRLLSTTHVRKLVYQLRKNATKS